MARPFAVFDIDGTLIRWQLYHAVTQQLAKSGHLDPEVFAEIQSARMLWKKRTHHESFKDYEGRLIKGYEKILEVISADQLESAINTVFEEYKDQVYTYTRELIKDLKKENYLLFAISGSQTEVVQKIASYYGFDDCVGSTYEQIDGKFTGNVEVGSAAKDKTLEELVKKHGTNYKDSLAIGDSESDIAMLESVEKPIAFNPETKLFNHASQKGWSIIVERKNVVYKLEQQNGKYVLA